jgi:hypothetical protein
MGKSFASSLEQNSKTAEINHSESWNFISVNTQWYIGESDSFVSFNVLVALTQPYYVLFP